MTRLVKEVCHTSPPGIPTDAITVESLSDTIGRKNRNEGKADLRAGLDNLQVREAVPPPKHHDWLTLAFSDPRIEYRNFPTAIIGSVASAAGWARKSRGVPRVHKTACWAHLWRDFHDVWKATGSAIAREALDQIGALYDIERDIAGRPADIRRDIRQSHSEPRVEALRMWCDAQLLRISGKGDLTKAMRYALRRWNAFMLFLEDGRVAIDTDVIERPEFATRPIAIGRKYSYDRLSRVRARNRRQAAPLGDRRV